MNAIRKIATTLGGVTLAVSGVLFAAPAAQADTNACLNYLQSQGYPYNIDHFYGCYHAKSDWTLCYAILRDAYVHPGVAARACDLGAA
ncbi:hypothetical protein AB0L74_31990 [Streptomyces sp. NPDC052020]|uniref:hypothetical protein n=1 Tax=Streptomyces sp. NPDC052020 TaxID=3155677 RepID=UPI003412D719